MCVLVWNLWCIIGVRYGGVLMCVVKLMLVNNKVVRSFLDLHMMICSSGVTFAWELSGMCIRTFTNLHDFFQEPAWALLECCILYECFLESALLHVAWCVNYSYIMCVFWIRILHELVWEWKYMLQTTLLALVLFQRLINRDIQTSCNKRFVLWWCIGMHVWWWCIGVC